MDPFYPRALSHISHNILIDWSELINLNGWSPYMIFLHIESSCLSQGHIFTFTCARPSNRQLTHNVHVSECCHHRRYDPFPSHPKPSDSHDQLLRPATLWPTPSFPISLGLIGSFSLTRWISAFGRVRHFEALSSLVSSSKTTVSYGRLMCRRMGETSHCSTSNGNRVQSGFCASGRST